MEHADDLRRRLRQLQRGARPPRRRPASPDAGRALPPGEVVTTSRGSAYRIETTYPLEHFHGTVRLADLLRVSPELAAQVAGSPGLEAVSPHCLAFLDTETSGLAGGAGTLVFLVGIGTFTEDGLRLRQYFLRDPAEEPGMLEALQQDLRHVEGFVTYNGRAFDVPLLEMRYLTGLRERWPLTEWPNLDLLHVARRLWRHVLPDCTLGTVEDRVLQVRRSQQDVPGAEIPSLYVRYLQTGDAGHVSRILYHNAVDVLTLVSLTAHVLQRHRHGAVGELSAAEALAVARWHARAGRADKAEEAYRECLARASGQVRLQALRGQTFQLKRQGRRSEAVAGWQEWHAMAPEDPLPCVELAKYYEWEARDLEQAKAWAQRALVCLTHWPDDWRRQRAWEEVQHRLQRLARKLGRGRP